jgi:SAM-dependent methyltransferase
MDSRKKPKELGFPAESDRPNQIAFPYWERSWEKRGVNGFSTHSTFVEQAKWSYLAEDLGVRNGIAVEIGCGSGHMAAVMAAEGYDVVLVDYSPAAIQCAKNSWRSLPGRERKSYVVGDALELPFQDNTVAAVISCGLLEHFGNPLAPIREMARVLKPGGLFYADICPRKISLIGALDFFYPTPKGWYEARLSKKDIHELITAAGLDPVRLFAAGVLPPRNIPGRGRFPIISRMQNWLIEHRADFWRSLDGSRLADLLGFYYYVSAEKPVEPGSLLRTEERDKTT